MQLRVNGLLSLAMFVTMVNVSACGPGTPPSGQPPVLTLTNESIEAFRGDFNKAVDQTRVVLLLSPT